MWTVGGNQSTPCKHTQDMQTLFLICSIRGIKHFLSTSLLYSYDSMFMLYSSDYILLWNSIQKFTLAFKSGTWDSNSQSDMMFTGSMAETCFSIHWITGLLQNPNYCYYLWTSNSGSFNSLTVAMVPTLRAQVSTCESPSISWVRPGIEGMVGSDSSHWSWLLFLSAATLQNEYFMANLKGNLPTSVFSYS